MEHTQTSLYVVTGKTKPENSHGECRGNETMGGNKDQAITNSSGTIEIKASTTAQQIYTRSTIIRDQWERKDLHSPEPFTLTREPMMRDRCAINVIGWDTSPQPTYILTVTQMPTDVANSFRRRLVHHGGTSFQEAQQPDCSCYN
ncbi:hypothetical protein JTB14_019533 [Gonioctena quinquepunctata]|nr:hypothetical protein JTB14_019533 [Gonioctena quinquepunctata]